MAESGIVKSGEGAAFGVQAGAGKARDPRRDRLFGKDFVLAWLAAFSAGMGAHMLLPTLPLYVKGFGGGDADVGLILGIFTISVLGTRFLVGRALDLWSRKWPLVVGGLLFFVLMPLYNVTITVPSIMLLRLVHGIGFGVVSTATTVVAADVAPLRRRGEAMGYFGLAMPWSMAVGPGFGMWLVALTDLPLRGFSLVFFACSAFVGVMLLLALCIRETHHSTKDAGTKAKGRGAGSFFSRDALPVAVPMGFAAVGAGAVMGFASLYLAGESADNVGIFFLIYAGMMAVARPIAGTLSDRLDRNALVVPLLAVCSAGIGLLSLSPSLPIAAAAAGLFGVGFGSLSSTLLALAVDIVRPQERGAAVAMFQASLDLGIAIGSMVLGVVAQVAGYPALFLTAACFDLVGMVYFLAYRRWRASRRASAV